MATVALTGTAAATIDETDVVAGGKTIILTVTDDTVVPASATNIQFVGGAAAGKVGATSGNSTIALSSGLTGGIASAVAAGDLVIAVFGTGAVADRTLAITDGTTAYTLIGTEQYADDTFDTNLRIAYKFMGGTPDASTTFGPTGDAADSGAMAVYVFRGVDPSTPLDVAAVPATGIDTSRANPPGITPTTAGAFVVCVGAAAHNGGVDTFTSGDLTGFLTQGGTNDTNDVTIGIGHFAWTTGEFNPAAFGHSQADSTSFSWAAMSIALRPAVTTPFANARAAIISGLDSAQSEAAGWDAKVKPNIPVANVVRTSGTVITITLQAQADYDITAQETITATVPASALVGNAPVVATPTFTVDPDVPPEGFAAPALTLGETGAGQSVRSGLGVVALALSLTGAGTATASGLGVPNLALDAAGVGVHVANGSSSVDLSLSSAGVGEAPADEVPDGFGSSQLALGVSGAGEHIAEGTGGTALGLDALGTGTAIHTGAGSSLITLNASGSGVSTSAGSSTPLLMLYADGDGAAVYHGDGTADLSLTAAGAGAVTHSGAGTPSLSLDGEGYGEEPTGVPTGRGVPALALAVLGEGVAAGPVIELFAAHASLRDRGARVTVKALPARNTK